MLSFLKSVFSFIFQSIPLFAKKVYYSGFNREIFNKINKNEGVFLEVLQFPEKNKKFVSQVFTSDESLDCFKLFLDAHKKDEKKYSRNKIRSLFTDDKVNDTLVKYQKFLAYLLYNNIPIYSNDSAKLDIKKVLRMYIDTKENQSLFKQLLSMNEEKKIKPSNIKRTLSIYGTSPKMKEHDNLKEILEFIDLLSEHSVNDQDIGKIFSDNNSVFDKMKDKSNKKLLKPFLKNQTTYNIDKIKEIFSFEKDIFNKMKDNLELVKEISKCDFDVSDIKDFFSKENRNFKIVKNDEQSIKYCADHKYKLSEIKNINSKRKTIKLCSDPKKPTQSNIPSTTVEDVKLSQHEQKPKKKGFKYHAQKFTDKLTHKSKR